MKHRLDLLQTDPAYRFDLSPSKASQIVITRTELLSMQVSVLVIWSSKSQIRKAPPRCFKTLYPKIRTIIDCTETHTVLLVH